jgi:hypothetical protein
MYKLDDIESQVTDNETRHALLSVLKARLAQLLQPGAECDSDALRLTEEKIAKLSEPAESSLQPQQSLGESDSLPTESDSSPAESDPHPIESDPPVAGKRFADQLEQLDPRLRQIASDLYEHLHRRSNFARLSADQRDTILELLKHHSAEKLAEILAKPPPLGMNLQTSKAGLNRFRDDFMRCALRRGKVEAQRMAEQQRLITEQLFQKASASDESFRQTTQAQIRKRLFHAAHDPASDYHEIRWLLKSLEMLRQ